MTVIDIWFDGGCKNQQLATRREAYGSFRTFHEDRAVEMTLDRGTRTQRKLPVCEINFGNATASEAEWNTLILALTYARQVQDASKNLLKFIFHGDAAHVIGAMRGESKIKAANLKPLYERAQVEVATLDAEFVKEDGDQVKKVLGH